MKALLSYHRFIALVGIFTLAVSLPALAQETRTIPSSTAAQDLKTSTAPALVKVQALPTQEYRTEEGVSAYKILADNLSAIAPELVQTRIETLPSPHPRMPHMTQQKRVPTVDYAAVVPLLVKAMQEQQSEIERLRNELSAMKAQAQK